MSTTQLRITDGVLMHEEDGEAFLLHTGTGRYFGLNRTGVAIWRALEAGDDPVEALGAHWPDVPVQDRQRDAEALIDHLVRAELVIRPDAD
jgi:hypothetical protein